MSNGINDNCYHFHRFQPSETPFTVIMHFKQNHIAGKVCRRNFAPQFPTIKQIFKKMSDIRN